jgi:hypothetical protein
MTSSTCGSKCHGKNLRSSAARQDATERFLRHVEKTGACWLWAGPCNALGYGWFNFGGKRERAHRASYRLFKGEVPLGKFVCHACDNPSCVNPDHLWLGDAQSNVDDMMRKGRHWVGTAVSGEDHPRHKITADVARAIRESTGVAREIAERYGVSRSLVYGIRAGTHWRHA